MAIDEELYPGELIFSEAEFWSLNEMDLLIEGQSTKVS